MRILSVLAGVVFMGALATYGVGAYRSGTVSLIPAMNAVGVPMPAEVRESAEQRSPATSVEYKTGEGEGEIKRLVIGLDLSKSNPMITDSDYALKVAQRISSMVKDLGFRSEVRVRTFGSFGGDENTFRFDALVSSRYRPEKLAKELELLIGNTPTLVSRGTWQPQDRTNIIGFLENMAQVVDCNSMTTVYILASDGLEESEYSNMKRQTSPLPHASGQFQGCDELLILGLGQGTDSPTMTKRMRDQWQEWAQAAGFKRFSGLNDW